MARPSVRTPKKLERMRAMRSSGKGLREVARELGLAPETVRTWEREASALVSRPRPTAPKGRTKKRPTAGPDAEAAAEVLLSPLPSLADPEALAEVRARHAIVRGLLERLTPAVEAEEYSAVSWVQLAKYADDVARLLAELSPPAPKDPDADENVLAAERAFLERVASLIESAERRSS